MEPIFTLTPSPVRRHLGTGMMLFLGAVLLYIAVGSSTNSSFSFLLFAALGVAVFLITWRIHTSTANALVLSKDGIHSTDGTLVAEVSNITRIEQGVFAFKPSNGFTIILTEPMAAAWYPGLWWRFGRRVGVGGVTPRAQGKLMAEHILVQMKKRD